MKKILTLLFLIGSISISKAQLVIPQLWGMRVHDEAKVLSSQTTQSLEQALKVFEDSTSNQIAILIINSLEGEALEDYALKVAEAWKLGDQKNDNGVLLLIAVNDRKIRIEVGEGLEGPLPDAMCSRIIRNEIAPAFRRQAYDEGVTAGVVGIMQAIKGEYTNNGTTRKREKSGNPLITIIIIMVVIIILSRFRGGNSKGSGWSSGAGWWGPGMYGGGSRSSGGGFGGFSGGGGSFGGGGSSGSW